MGAFPKAGARCHPQIIFVTARNVRLSASGATSHVNVRAAVPGKTGRDRVYSPLAGLTDAWSLSPGGLTAALLAGLRVGLRVGLPDGLMVELPDGLMVELPDVTP